MRLVHGKPPEEFSMAPRKKKKKAHQSKRKVPAAKKKSTPPKQAVFNTPFLVRFKNVFLKGPPDGWPELPFSREVSRQEIPLIVRMMLEISDLGSLPAGFPASSLRTRLENFLTAEHWLDDRLPPTPVLHVRNKEIARIADMLLRIHNKGDGTAGHADDWPPPR
jgi:hypothetical protein